MTAATHGSAKAHVYKDKNGTVLTAAQFDGDWPFVDKPPDLNKKLGAKIKKLADAARKKKSA